MQDPEIVDSTHKVDSMPKSKPVKKEVYHSEKYLTNE